MTGGFFLPNDIYLKKVGDLTTQELLAAIVAANKANQPEKEGQVAGGLDSYLDFSSAAGSCAVEAGDPNNLVLEVAVPEGDFIRDVYLRIPKILETGVNNKDSTVAVGTMDFFKGKGRIGSVPVTFNSKTNSASQKGTYAGQHPVSYSVAFGFPSSQNYNSANSLGTNSAAGIGSIMVFVQSDTGALGNIYIPVSITARLDISRVVFTLNRFTGSSTTGNETMLAFLGILTRAA